MEAKAVDVDKINALRASSVARTMERQNHVRCDSVEGRNTAFQHPMRLKATSLVSHHAMHWPTES
jgi:hypothetical protein